MDALLEPFLEFAFMRRALVGCVALSVSAAPLGVFLILRRMSLTGDAMAHAILPGVALGYLVAGLSLPAMTLGGVAAGITVALLSGAVARFTVLREDASLAAFYLISLATGVVIISASGDSVDLLQVLFGTVLALDDAALYLVVGVATVTLPVFAGLYRPLVAECVDPGFLRSVGGPGLLAHLAFLVLVVLNLVAGFQALGSLLVVGIMVLPGAAARFWARELTGLLAVAVLVALLASFAGLLASYHFDLPSGPTIILAAGGAYIASLVLGPSGGLLAELWSRRHLEA